MNLDKLREYDEVLNFEVKVENARDNLDLVDYYNRILSSLLASKRKDILNENKDMILSNIHNLIDTVCKVRKFISEEL